ncbi:MAG: deoxyguanosinetriphosphate triphosphohydrolase [Chloroflexi bacterium]|nr:deoxyguanosinetriphosphate triphosphohydrolase [Chloroflexota bacterium]
MMIHSDIRFRIEESERRLSPCAAKSRFSRGRLTPEEPSPVRAEFQRDRDRLIHSKSFRRLKHKTQVFIAPLGDHYVTRLTHTLEVAQIARTIARALNLNEDLTEAIATGHDLGHTPFGHAGEETLNRIYQDGFHHNEQSLRVVDLLEKNGQGLNLTWEVRDGILRHSKARDSVVAEAWGVARTIEGQIVKIADSIAYVNHDIGDAIRAGLITDKDLPARSVAILGQTHAERINNVVCNIIETSWDMVRSGEDSAHQTQAEYAETRRFIEDLADQNKPLVQMGERVLEALDELREFMFQKVYIDSAAKEEVDKAQQLVETLYGHFCKHPEQLPQELQANPRGEPIERIVCDYVSGMTDWYALRVFEEIYVPRLWSVPSSPLDLKGRL